VLDNTGAWQGLCLLQSKRRANSLAWYMWSVPSAEAFAEAAIVQDVHIKALAEQWAREWNDAPIA
jgi:hypothetical protein